ncbi:MAG: T9SS type A sorting domain-containing protein [Flavobacteriales bacterium]|nr:T9SS type A sorting domain-containing protein [Flavobacteriales bacterium]
MLRANYLVIFLFILLIPIFANSQNCSVTGPGSACLNTETTYNISCPSACNCGSSSGTFRISASSGSIIKVNGQTKSNLTSGWGTLSWFGVTGSVNVEFLSTGASTTYTLRYYGSQCNSSCSHGQKVVTLNQSPDPSWKRNQVICLNNGAFDLNSIRTGVPGGTWTCAFPNTISGSTFTPNSQPTPPYDYQITYSVNQNGCTAEDKHFLKVVSSFDASWNAPATLCEESGLVDLNSFITGNPSGTWTSSNYPSAISNGHFLSTTGLAGANIQITYTLGAGQPCNDSETHTILISNGGGQSQWNNPQFICGKEVYNLDDLVTLSNTNGTWSTDHYDTWRLSGSNFDPRYIFGETVTFNYAYNNGTCLDVQSGSIEIVDRFSYSSWNVPNTFNSGPNLIDLNQYVTSSNGSGWWFSPTHPNAVVSGQYLSTAAYAGETIMLCYMVGGSNACTGGVLEKSVSITGCVEDPTWGNPGSLCRHSTNVNLNGFITGTTGGSWSSSYAQAINGNNLNPSIVPSFINSITVTYTVGSGNCQTSSSQQINLLNAVSAAWSSPSSICESNNLFNLSNLTVANQGGTWSSPSHPARVNGVFFNATGLAGQTVTIRYSVGDPNSPCSDYEDHTIQIINDNNIASWNPPAPLCISQSPVDLDDYITGTPGGTWSGSGITNGFFYPGSLMPGSYSITYTVNGQCQSPSETHNITIENEPNVTLINSATICEDDGNQDLNALFHYSGTTTPGGTWSGTGVFNGHFFNPTNNVGTHTLTYTASIGSCQDSETATITVISSQAPQWNLPDQVCTNFDTDPFTLNDYLLPGTPTNGTWYFDGNPTWIITPANIAPGTYPIYYQLPGNCATTVVDYITFLPRPNASLQNPADLCFGANVIDLRDLFLPNTTTGGTWSGTGVYNGHFWNPGNNTGNIDVTYTVGNAPCEVSNTITFNIIPSCGFQWNGPTELCDQSSIIDLNSYFTGNNVPTNPNNYWTGSPAVINGHFLNPALAITSSLQLEFVEFENNCCGGLFATISLYSDSAAEWNVPPICNFNASIDLNDYLTNHSVPGGAWSGQGVSSTGIFNPSGLSGMIPITYTVSNGNCLNAFTNDIKILPLCNYSWTSPGTTCSNEGLLNLNDYLDPGTPAGGIWSGTGVVNGHYFDQTGLSGPITLTYSSNNSNCCSYTTGVINVVDDPVVSWSAPEIICENSGPIDLSAFIDPTSVQNGYWTGPQVHWLNGTFNPSGLSGDIYILYEYGAGACYAEDWDTITIVPGVTADWDQPQPLCESTGSVNLNTYLNNNSTTGGTWYSPTHPNAVNGSILNLTGLSNNVCITYVVGQLPCKDSLTRQITVVPDVNAGWTPPSAICQSGGLVDLNSYLDTNTTGNGTWSSSSHPNSINGSILNLYNINNTVSLTYTVGQGTCVESETHSLSVLPEADATWNAPTAFCNSNQQINLWNYLPLLSTIGGTWSSSTHPNAINSNGILDLTGVSGNLIITYTAGTAPCDDSKTHSITVQPQVNADWTCPGSICGSLGSVNLNTFLTQNSTTGGTWSSSTHPNAINGSNFSFANITGNVLITYTVGSLPCQESRTRTINIEPGVDASWTPPTTLCGYQGTINLNNYLAQNASTGGNWISSTHPNAINGSVLNLSGINGTVSITYEVGSGPCHATETHSINVEPVLSSDWTAPNTLCNDLNNLNLSQYLIPGTATNGTWYSLSHPSAINGSNLNLTGLSGIISVSYSVGNVPCEDITTRTINIVPSVNATWTGTNLCSSNLLYNLNSLLANNATPNGTWTSSSHPGRITGNSLNMAGLTGTITITYSVGNGPCTDSHTDLINIITAGNPGWNAPQSLCQDVGTINLNNYLSPNATAGGTWSSSSHPLAISGSTLNLSTVFGVFTVTYTVNNGNCSSEESHNINISPDISAGWTPPTLVCAASGTVDLNTYRDNGTFPGGTWSSISHPSAITGSILNLNGINGGITIKYQVSNAACDDEDTHIINVIPSVYAGWTPPSTPICEDTGSVDLSNYLNVGSTANGNWSSSTHPNAINGTVLNLSGISGNVSVTYSVGSSPCDDSETHHLTITPSVNASWNSPGSVCQITGSVNLNNYLTVNSTQGGQWLSTSHPNAVNGSTLNVSQITGTVQLSYSVSNGQCSDEQTGQITVTPDVNANWNNPGTICAAMGSLNLNNYLTGNSSTGGTWTSTSHPNAISGSTLNLNGLSGTVTVTYSVGVAPCDKSVSNSFTVLPNVTPDWTPLTVCEGSANINLTSLLNAGSTPNGTWSSATHASRVNGAVLNINNFVGQISVTYSVGTGNCVETATHFIVVLPNLNASWNPPSNICGNTGTIDLNSYLGANSTQGGVWTSSTHPNLINGSILNINGLIGNVTITYTVGTSPCENTETKTINVSPEYVANWIDPGTLCQNTGILDLNNYLAPNATQGGTWTSSSHPGAINGNLLNLAMVSGTVTLTYSVGSGYCKDDVTRSFNTLPFSQANCVYAKNICDDGNLIPLNSLLASGSTYGGTWTGPGVNNSNGTFDPSGITGTVTLTYTVGTSPCDDQCNVLVTVGSVCADFDLPDYHCSLPCPFPLDSLASAAGCNVGGVWSGPGVNNGIFNPNGLTGTISITHTININGCTATHTETTTILPRPNADWFVWNQYCANNGVLNLSMLVQGDQGGTWTGTGVINGHYLDPNLVNGSTTLTYTVNNGVCGTSKSGTITIVPSYNAQWTNPGTLCAYDDYNLNQLLDPNVNTFGGTWSGPGVYNDSLLDIDNVSGPVQLTYSVGTGTCHDSKTHIVNIQHTGSCAWTPPIYSCSDWGPIDLNNFLNPGTPAGGTWSGPSITGSIFDPAPVYGKVEVTYTYGTGNCVVSCSDTIFVNDKVSVDWTAPDYYCESDGVLDLNTLLDPGTYTPGTWFNYSQVIPNGLFDPSGLNGPEFIQYRIGAYPCSWSQGHVINIVPANNTAWNAPNSVCQQSNLIDLNSYLSSGATQNGVWSGSAIVNDHYLNTLDTVGFITITYTDTTVGCSNGTSHVIEIQQAPSAQWFSPVNVCQTGGLVNLNNYLAPGTPSNGYWTAPGLTNVHYLDPSLLNGQVNILYEVASNSNNCYSSVDHTISIVNTFNANWTSPGSFCVDDTVNLNDFLDASATPFGQWGPNSVVFNDSLVLPGTVSGNVNLVYDVGNGTSCRDFEFHSINFLPGAVADWTPTYMCELSNPLNLNSLLDNGSSNGGTWSGQYVNGNTFNPNYQTGDYEITYTVGSGQCQDVHVDTITVDPYAYAGFQGHTDICVDAGWLDLYSLLNSNASGGGTWSSSGFPNAIVGHYFNPSGLAGQDVHILYSAGQNPCVDQAGGWIHVKANNLNSSWNNPGSVPANGGLINLNSQLTNNATTGGTWTGSGVAGNLFNPAGLSGAVSVTYTVDNGTCTSATTHSITISGSGSNQTQQQQVDTICDGQISLLSYTNLDPNHTYNVYDHLSGGNLLGQLPMYVQPATSQNYFVEELDAAGIPVNSVRDSLAVVVQQVPGAIGSIVTDICDGEDASFALSSYNYEFVLWTDSVGGTQIGTTPTVISPNQSSIYYLNALDPITGCASAARSSFEVTVLAKDIYAYSVDICSGDSINFHGQNLQTSGVYQNILTNTNGCDSVEELTLAVLPTSDVYSAATICKSDSILFAGQYLNASGIYSQKYQGVNGCDSTLTLSLQVSASVSVNLDTTICTGDTLHIDNTNFYSAGSYNTVISSTSGCDSIRVINLTVSNPVTPGISIVPSALNICANEEVYVQTNVTNGGSAPVYQWFLNGSGISQSAHDAYINNLQDGDVISCTLTSSENCLTNNQVVSNDLVMQVNAISIDTLVHQICDGATLAFGGNTYNTSGLYIDTLSSINGCDSISILDLTVNANPTVDINSMDTQFEVGETIDFNTNGSNANQYTWNFGDGNTDYDANPSYQYTSDGLYMVIVEGSSNGCVGSDTVYINIVSGTTGISDFELHNSIKVYPNPSNDVINISFAKNANDLTISLFDLNGKLVLQNSEMDYISQTAISVESMANGVYLLKINNEEINIIHEVVVSH